MMDTQISEYKLTGYIAGDTFASRGNSHFATMDGHVICGQTNRFGMDCSFEIRLRSMTDFYTDQTIKFEHPHIKTPISDPMNLRRGNLPLDRVITCKKCLKYLEKQLR